MNGPRDYSVCKTLFTGEEDPNFLTGKTTIVNNKFDFHLVVTVFAGPAGTYASNFVECRSGVNFADLKDQDEGWVAGLSKGGKSIGFYCLENVELQQAIDMIFAEWDQFQGAPEKEPAQEIILQHILMCQEKSQPRAKYWRG